MGFVLAFYVIVTWMARALLSKELVNTPRPNTHKATMGDVSKGLRLLRFARQQRTNKYIG
jgi:hypothetical protein